MPDVIEPEDPTERIITRLDRLIEGVEAGTVAVAAESSARRKSLAIMAVLGLLLVASVSYTGYRWVRANEATCGERVARTIQLRDAMVAIVAIAAEFYEVPPAERADLLGTIKEDLRDRYPDPDC